MSSTKNDHGDALEQDKTCYKVFKRCKSVGSNVTPVEDSQSQKTEGVCWVADSEMWVV